MSNNESQRVKDQYDKISGAYDAVIDRLIPDAWRQRATGFACGYILEVGIGTGLNLSFYPDSCKDILGIDVSLRMLDRANRKKALCKAPVKLEVMDIQALPLPSGSFDTVLASFVFCTVPDPAEGLRECYRILKPGGRLILLEHMISGKRLLQHLMNCINPLTVKILGDHINRNTLFLVTATGFRTQVVENLFGDVVRLIVAVR